MRQLTALDAQFLAFEDGRSHGHVSGLALYDPSTAPEGHVDLQDVIALFGERLALIPPFHQRLVEVPLGLDHPYWADDPNFDLEYHIRELALPAPGNHEQLCEQVGRLHARPLDRSHPLWELYVISGLADGLVAVFTKVHHALIDGLSGAEILMTLADFTPTGRELPRATLREPAPLPGTWTMLARGLLGVPRWPLRAARGLPRTLRFLDENPVLRTIPGTREIGRGVQLVPGLRRPRNEDGGLLEAPRAKAPRTRFNGPVTAHRRVAITSLSLTEVKRVKNYHGVTVNDVVVTLCAGALRSWLGRRDELPEDPLVAMVPLSVRTPEQFGTYGNRVSAMFVAIPTHLDDPGERLAFAHQTLDSAKTVHRALPATVMQDTGEFVPPAILARASRLATRMMAATPLEPLCNVVISNVPGSQLPMYMSGALLKGHFPISAVAHSVGLNLTVLSYLESLDFGIVGDREQLDDAWELAADLEKALAELVGTIDQPQG